MTILPKISSRHIHLCEDPFEKAVLVLVREAQILIRSQETAATIDKQRVKQIQTLEAKIVEYKKVIKEEITDADRT